MATRSELLSARSQLYEVIRASEEWDKSYKKDRATFKRLVENESSLNTAVSEYLYGLSQRAVSYVDWSKLPIIAADRGPVLNNDDPAWRQEMARLTALILDLIIEQAQTGADAGEAFYAALSGLDLRSAILTYARNHTAQLVSQVTETSRDLIRESVRQSIAMGEDAPTAIERLTKVINNPVRAEMIAQTESVNAYQGGLATYATATGAQTKTWDGLVGACKICEPVIGQTINIDEQFVLANGDQVDHPAGHPRCRCSLIYNY